jgi:ComF family protein
MFSDFLSLIFPESCISCNEVLYKREEYLCTACRFRLPKTNHHLDPGNPLLKRFWGKVPMSYAVSYLKFTKGGSVQNILYKIKYEGMKEGAKKLGLWYGQDLRMNDFQKKVDLLVSVPLHKKKLKKRGYNQSDLFAEGLAASLCLDFYPQVLERASENTSQTLKSRFDRWLNVKDIYKVREEKRVIGKHVLIVDDVVTTGATIEACARELLNKGAREVSVAAIASAQ